MFLILIKQQFKKNYKFKYKLFLFVLLQNIKQGTALFILFVCRSSVMLSVRNYYVIT